MVEPRYERVRIADLNPATYNPRRISNDALAGLRESVERFGLVEPIIINKDRTVIGGHQRLKVLQAKGVEEATVAIVDLPYIEERALNVSLNNRHIAGEFIEDELKDLLEEIQEQNVEMYDALVLDPLLKEITEKLESEAESVNSSYEGETDPDDAPESEETEERVQAGDIWQLGEHRLFCGDTTSNGISRVLDGDRVDSLVTDPPYGVDYGEKNEMLNENDAKHGIRGKRIEKKIANDAIKNYRSWFASWLGKITWAESATFYIFMSSVELHNLRLAIEDCGYHWSDYLVWVKNNHVLSRKDYHSKLEIITYGWPKKHKFHAKDFRTTVLEYDRPQKNDLHPTMKPVALVQQLVCDGSRGGGIVLDPFGGSGTTMIACQTAGRSCRMIELDARYCDVIISRWESFTGKRAQKIS
jgi:DNA modification methylase